MLNRILLSVLSLALAGLMAGCAATGGNQFQNTVYDTHNRVARLDKNLQSSVTRLNETTATLLTRVDESDQQLENVQGMLDQNQTRLASLEKKLDSLTNIIYRQQGRTLLPGGQSPAQPLTEVEVGNDAYGVTPGAGSSQYGAQQQQAPAPAAPAPGAAPATSPPTAAVAPSPGAAPVQPEWQPPEQPALDPVEVAPQPAAAAPPPPSSGSPDADYLDAQKSYARQDYEGALQKFGAFLQRYPLSAQAQNAQFWRAKSFQALERYEEAIAEYNRLRDAYPAAPGENALNSKVPSAMHQQAVCHARLGQTERAIELFKQVIRDFPNSPAAAQATSDLQRLQ